MEHRPLRIIVAGGTLDKVHDVTTESLAFPADGSSMVPDILHKGRCYFPLTQIILQKDSLDFTDKDREMVRLAVEGAKEDQIVITHGTGTMGETARYLADHISGKTVVLTGAMRPHSLSVSDASFNLGGAIIAAQSCPFGVYGVMNGRVFAASDLNKNISMGRFDV